MRCRIYHPDLLSCGLWVELFNPQKVLTPSVRDGQARPCFSPFRSLFSPQMLSFLVTRRQPRNSISHSPPLVYDLAFGAFSPRQTSASGVQIFKFQPSSLSANALHPSNLLLLGSIRPEADIPPAAWVHRWR